MNSNNFNNSWNQSGTTRTSGQSGYDGTNDAWKIERDGAAGLAFIHQTISTTGVHTQSIYAKANTEDWIYLQDTGTGGGNGYFDLVNGVAGTTTGIDASIDLVGDGWYRIQVVGNRTASGNIRVFVAKANGNLTVTGSIYIQDSQFEAGLVATDVMTSGSVSAQAGILEDMPRIDYTSGTGALLLEGLRTNSLAHSEYLLNYSVFGTSPTRTTNYGISPEGVKNSTRIQLDNGDLFGRSPSLSSNTYTFSLFAKNIEGGGNVIQLRFDIPATKYAEFDLSDGTLVQSTTDDEGIEDYGNGWYRCYITMNSSTISNIVVSRPNGSSLDCEVFGLQMEIGSYPTSYIPSYGSAVSRSADDCEISTLNSGILGTGKGSFYLEGYVNTLDGNGIIPLTAGTSIQNLFYIWIRTSGTLQIEWYQGGGLQASLQTSADTLNVGDSFKIGVAYQNNDFVAYLDGNQIAFDSSGTAPNPTSLQLGQYTSGAYKGGALHKTIVFPTRLTNTELAALTA